MATHKTGKSFNQSQGVRANRYSGSKLTNWREFNPAGSSLYKIYSDHYSEFINNKNKVSYIKQKIHPNFIMPLTISGIKKYLENVPEKYYKNIRAIFLLSGSNKQEKVFFSKLFCYGTYMRDCIFIHPYPKKNMNLIYKKPPKPNVLNDYRRVGALIEKDDTKGTILKWTPESLKDFYYRDVLMHEIGHHYDKYVWVKSNKKAEGFAEWFATEYGFKFKYLKD